MRPAPGCPGSCAGARNRWQVTALDGGRSRVAFHAELEVRGPLGWLFRAWLLARVGRTGGYLLDDLRHYVEHGVPSPRKRPPADPVLAVGVWPTTSLLRSMLRANAVFSVVCGLMLVAAGWWVAAPWGLGPAVVPPVVGVGVAAFGVLVAWLAVQPGAVLRRWAVAVVVADLGWVAGSVGLLVMESLPGPGAVAVGAVAAVVAGLAVGQVAGLAAVRDSDPLADVEVMQVERVLATPPAAVWPLITDHDLYGRLAPNLSTVEVISETGAPLRRRCVNTAGQGWEETCTLWEDGRRFAVAVDTTRYPYPLILMRGLWQVDPHPAGSRVTMRFAYRAAPSVRGGLFAIALRVLFPPALNRILRGWQQRSERPTPAEARGEPAVIPEHATGRHDGQHQQGEQFDRVLPEVQVAVQQRDPDRADQQ
jgi:hypothetical protein